MKQKHSHIVIGIIVPIVVLLGASAYMLTPHTALSQSASTVSGWGWSDTIGWISFSCFDVGTCTTSNYGVTVAPDGTLSGYAWSDNIGWVSAEASDLAGCPISRCTAKITGNALEGWLKALGGGTAQSGGWDGWISLSGPDYGPTLQNTGYFSGYSWGDVNVGWMDSRLIVTNYTPCTASYICNGQTIVHHSAQCNDTLGPTCTSPYFCSPGSSICLLPPPSFIPSGVLTGHLQVRPQLVRKDGSTTVFWNVENVTDCTVTGTNGDSWTGTSSDPSGETSGAISEQTIYTLFCTALDGSTLRETATVNILPVFQEK